MLPLALLKHRVVVYSPKWLHSELDWEVDAGRKGFFNLGNFHYVAL